MIWIDGALEMSVGKAAAQVGHGVMLLIAGMGRGRLDEWITEGLPVAVREAGAEHWRALSGAAAAGEPGVATVVDAGYTEVAPGSITVIAVDGPDPHTGTPASSSGVAQSLERTDHDVAVGGLPERRQ